MKRNRDSERRKLSFGSVFMLCLLATVLAGSALVLGRLSSGASIDTTKLNMDMLNLQSTGIPGTNDRAGRKDRPEATAPRELKPAAATRAPADNRAAEDAPAQAGYTLTVGGTVALSGEVRKNCWNPDSKVNDYSDVMQLLAPEVHSDVNAVFLENLFTDEHKASDTVAPESACGMLREGGFNLAACGFSQAYSKGGDAIETTRMVLMERGIEPVGTRDADDQQGFELKTTGGMKTAFLQYTDTVPSKTRKSMEKAGESGMVPEAELDGITREISEARSRGAEAVIVLINWGKSGKSPDRRQRELAEGIAAAGADLIVGNGSLVPQAAEYLTGKNGRSVLCVWSLGSLFSGERKNVKYASGYLLHVTVRSNGQGGADILNPEYTPVYTWKYKQDSRYYYRCVPSAGKAPDGMDNEQRKNMEKSEEAVREALNGSPLTLREQEQDADQ